ncbi:PhoH-like ATPase [Caldanaerobius fijiensis DSM 17918]|uniref:PhoH-like ATPase n=1 Tax=Caldanaerobius fijiensis DSM 17918 TaxID=1121256 RepID=A0A1M5DLM9_9THEO|nr:PhoH family protein [Caldanaerobius fijiensis]SHF67672.1 PhoH-like ATPase [Caldanaerobius fijiensis DSM 17918]
MKKKYVLDTNVLLHDPECIFNFQDNDIILPAVVIEEIDEKKKNDDEIGRNARRVARILDELRKKGRLSEGVKLDGGGVLKVELNHRAMDCLRESFVDTSNDNRILAVALNLKNEELKKENPMPVVLVSKDVILRIKADSFGLAAEDYLSDKTVQYDDIYMGFSELKVYPSIIDKFYMEKGISLKDFIEQTGLGIKLYPNQYVILKDEFGSGKSAIARYDLNSDSLKQLIVPNEGVWGIMPRNVQQKMALDLLLNDNILLVTLTGRAGTGKTLLALAAGLLKTQDERVYNKLLVARPVIPMGRDLGYLPGDKNEKLRPWMQPIYDNMEYLFSGKKNMKIDDIIVGLKNIEVEALTYIRGRSIPNQFIIIDEAQNLTRHEVKTIISRVGEGSKIVMIGDPEQIDNPYLDSSSNGLTQVVETFKDQSLAGHVMLLKGERSRLAELAASLL